MQSNWKLWVDARTETTAHKLLDRVLKRMGAEASGVEITPYDKGGHLISFHITHAHQSWSNLVLECIALGQRTAHGWAIYGDIYQDPGSSSSTSNVAGVDMIEWRLHAPGSTEA